MAAIARKIYLNKNSGVGQLAKVIFLLHVAG
jgi:hypothetical protein